MLAILVLYDCRKSQQSQNNPILLYLRGIEKDAYLSEHKLSQRKRDKCSMLKWFFFPEN